MLKRVLLACAIFALIGAAAPAPDAAFPCVDDALDLHGDPANADLVVFAGGNQWFAMPAIFAAFRHDHPEVRSVFYETLPPGLLAQQLESGALQLDELQLHVLPDVFLAGRQRTLAERDAGFVGEPAVYASNGLAILVRAGNPKHITSLADLGRPDVRVAMPNPATEGIARQIQLAYAKAGGDALVKTIMVTKKDAGTTMLTSIHHRQTPMWLLNGRADAGPVWISEALYQQRIESGLVAVPISDAQNVTGLYLGAVATRAPHAAAAKAFVAFLQTPAAQAIYRSYGFGPPGTSEE
jgi:ABC-type molybdate transport system substrate-binding protein